MNERRRDLQRNLLAAVGRQLSELGFSSQATNQAFHRPFEGGRSGIHLSFVDHQEAFDVTVDVAVRFDVVEDMVTRHNKLLSAREKLNTYTVGAELGNIADGKPRRWTVSSDKDIVRVSEEIAGYVTQVGMPYLSRFEDPMHALKVLSANDSASWLHSPVHGARCQRVVGIAKMLNTADFRDVVRRCDLFLEERNDPGLRAFRHFVGSLN